MDFDLLILVGAKLAVMASLVHQSAVSVSLAKLSLMECAVSATYRFKNGPLILIIPYVVTITPIVLHGTVVTISSLLNLHLPYRV